MNIFENVQMKRPGYSRFDLSHDVKMSFRMGQLIPSCILEVVPGDKFNISVQNLLRFAPLVSPVMHRIHVTTHYFFVPNRIIWPEWEDFMSGEDVEAPYVDYNNLDNPNTVGIYLGLPLVSPPNTVKISALPIAAYNKIFNEYYRDQNLVDEIDDSLVAGDNTAPFINWLNSSPPLRAWRHDYFTSALPFAQKGDAALLPLGTFSNVTVELQDNLAPLTGPVWRQTNLDPGPNTAIRSAGGPNQGQSQFQTDGSIAYYDPQSSLVASTSDLEAEAADINTVRRAFRLQEFLEAEARGGTRYTEQILSHFGVRSSDSRLQRPEYIGGAKQNMVISEVLSTAETDNQGQSTPVGNMAGHGISVGGSSGFNYRTEEHGYIVGIINVQPVTAYQQGVHRTWTRFSRLDYYWPEFANIGEQEIKVKELYADTTAAEQEEIFGYIPRYSEYKYMDSRVAGEMQTSLSFWHLGRIFANKPTLSSDFINCDPSTRIFAVEAAEDHIYAHVYNSISAIRPMPKYGIPTI